MDTSRSQQETRHHTYLILGAGPAGLQLGYFLGRAGRDYLILEAGEPGEFFKRFPRHRMLISTNKVYTGYDDPEINLRWDWNSLLSDDHPVLFKDFNQRYFPPADDMVRYLGAFASTHDLRIRCNTRVVSVERESPAGRFLLADQEGNFYTCDRLIAATGVSRPYLPDIPGIELVEPYTEVSVDPQDFVNQKVLVLGKGNSAFETADNLIGTAALIHVASPNPLKLAWKTHFVGHLRAVNNNFLDTYQLKSQNAVLDCNIEKIERREDGTYAVLVRYSHAEGESEVLFYDRVIACTGFRFDASIFAGGCRPGLAIDDRFPAQTSAWESVNVPGLYFAGTITQVRDFKKVTSGFIHGFRYNVRALHRILESRYHGNGWPVRTIEATPEGVTSALLARINRSSALWQQFGFLSDLVVVPREGGEARYFEELPVDYIHDGELGRDADSYILTLEFGKVEGDPFNIERHPDPDKAERSTFLHPVVRHFSGDRLLSVHHLLENLYGEWKDGVLHAEPLLAYLRAEMTGGAPDFDRTILLETQEVPAAGREIAL